MYTPLSPSAPDFTHPTAFAILLVATEACGGDLALALYLWNARGLNNSIGGNASSG